MWKRNNHTICNTVNRNKNIQIGRETFFLCSFAKPSLVDISVSGSAILGTKCKLASFHLRLITACNSYKYESSNNHYVLCKYFMSHHDSQGRTITSPLSLWEVHLLTGYTSSTPVVNLFNLHATTIFFPPSLSPRRRKCHCSPESLSTEEAISS